MMFQLLSKARKAKAQLKEVARKWVPLTLRPRPRYLVDSLLFKHDKVLLDSIGEMLDLPGVGKVVDKRRCRMFVKHFREDRLPSSAMLGALASLCLSIKNSQ
jgi:hypothetical protein